MIVVCSELTTYSLCSGLLYSGIFRGGGLASGPPFQLTIIFYDGIFGRFTNSFRPEHQNLGIH